MASPCGCRGGNGNNTGNNNGRRINYASNNMGNHVDASIDNMADGSVVNQAVSMANNRVSVSQVPTECPALVHESVCVSADVTITPNVVVGEIESFCVGGPIIGACPGTPALECVFTVSQNICVQIPLTFSAIATAVPSGIVCGTPLTGPCTL